MQTPYWLDYCLMGQDLGSFPSMISSVDSSVQVQKVQDIAPYFSITIPPMLDVMAALVFAFMLGLGIAYSNSTTMLNFFHEFKEIITKTISVAIIPLLPIYIFGIFLNMTVNGQAYTYHDSVRQDHLRHHCPALVHTTVSIRICRRGR
jgi:Na+/H+-dicarboxylate symporter